MTTDPRAPQRTCYRTVDSPVGVLTLAGDGVVLTHVLFADQTHPPAGREQWVAEPKAFAAAVEQLGEYFAGERYDFDVPLRLEGTDFQTQVWAALLDIPYGCTESYGALATRLGRPGASRAVGLANGRNPAAVIVPCHRVIGATGALTGYGGGIERKRALLDLERDHRTPRLAGLGR